MNIIDEFEKIRDIPYRIPPTPYESDDCCTGKSIRLQHILKDAGYAARYRICTFLWSDLDLPNEVREIPHENDSSHQFLEVKIGDEWKVVDPTWDKGLKSIFEINHWDGRSDTKIAVPMRRLLSPEESVRYIENISSEEAVIKDLKVNGDFYKAFNNWLVKLRK